MCMPFVIPKSSRMEHLMEAKSIRCLHQIRIAVHLMERADKDAILDRVPGVDLASFEAYEKLATKAMCELVKAYVELRESVKAWRDADNAAGAREYTI